MGLITDSVTLESLFLDQRGEGGWWLPGIPIELWTDDEGKPHREEGPAATLQDGAQLWYLDGLLHRTDGPAVLGPPWGEVWFQHGAIHRLGGPAITRETDGVLERTWIEEGQVVRDRPFAVYSADGVELCQFWRHIPPPMHLSYRKYPELDGPIPPGRVADPAQRYWWFRYSQPEPKWYVSDPPKELWIDADRRPHREDGPAIIASSGTQFWLRDGLFHRTRGPARVGLTGGQWWQDGHPYRADGPHRVHTTLQKRTT